jgi:hypothetical protein
VHALLVSFRQGGVSTFLQMEEEADKLSHINRECPVPKPKGVIGELLGLIHGIIKQAEKTKCRKSKGECVDVHALLVSFRQG